MSAIPNESSRASAVAGRPHNQNVVLYDGSGLNVDMGSYLAQHDLVYQSPPTEGSQAMPLGDGDLGAMLWCPGTIKLQIQKSDLWADPPAAIGPESNWRQVSAGSIGIRTDPCFVDDPDKFEQRLSLNSGVVTLQSDNAHGACQVTAFVSASAGVIVLHYRDQTVRGAVRKVETSIWRQGHVFALNDMIGVLQAFPDRRYAMLAKVVGRTATAKMETAHQSSLAIEAGRSSEFTVYIAVATSPRNGDPVASARSRIDAAVHKGFERLLVEHRHHWNMFWQKSFLRLQGGPDDLFPSYLENLWYLSLYQMACCSRGFDAPLANGALWLTHDDQRDGPAIYQGEDIRAMVAGLISTNHLELSVPFVDTYYRILPDLAARTSSEYSMAGGRFPPRFNRFGREFDVASETDDNSSDLRMSKIQYDMGDGLDTALVVWEAFRHAPDPFFLHERAYPLLRTATNFIIEYFRSISEHEIDPLARCKAVTALDCLIWAHEEFGVGEEYLDEWKHAMDWLTPGVESAYRPIELHPFGSMTARSAASILQAALLSMEQKESGLFGQSEGTPDLGFSARLISGINNLLLAETSIAKSQANNPFTPEESAAQTSLPPGAIDVCPALPNSWSAAFSLAAPGGFRISVEAVAGKPIYIAVKSLLGGICRIVNPWGPNERVKISSARVAVAETSTPIIEFVTKPNTSYLIDPAMRSITRMMTYRLGGKANVGPKQCGRFQLGIAAIARPTPTVVKQSNTRLGARETPESVPVTGLSRIDRARANHTP